MAKDSAIQWMLPAEAPLKARHCLAALGVMDRQADAWMKTAAPSIGF
jgi:hypothetical protein